MQSHLVFVATDALWFNTAFHTIRHWGRAECVIFIVNSAGFRLKREKRNLWQFRNMIHCATGRSAWDYNGYGCWCGLGGSGLPVDSTDRYLTEVSTRQVSSFSLLLGTLSQLYTSRCNWGLLSLLYIELTISFLIDRKRTVNFRNQRTWRHNCRLYNNHVKDTQGQG